MFNQTYTDWEWIIVHDGLEDNGLKEIIESYGDQRIRYYAIERATPPHNHDSKKAWCIEGSNAANFALDHVKGQWIARLDDDDIWIKDHLEESLKFAVENGYEFVMSAQKDYESPFISDYLHLNKKSDLKVGPHSSWFYNSILNYYRYNPECYKKEWNQVADTDMLERMYKDGRWMGFLDKELTIIKPRPGDSEIGLRAVRAKEQKKGIAANCQSNLYENSNRENFSNLIDSKPFTTQASLWEQTLYLSRIILTRLLVLDEIYKEQMKTHGVIIQCGVFRGRDLSLFINLRGIYEPFKYTRKIIGFDTFGGLPEFHENDGSLSEKGDFMVSEGYEDYLEKVLQYHEGECPLSHIKKFELVKGDIRKTLPEYLKSHPETIISLLYLDMDLYGSTKFVLDYIEPYLVNGSIIVFDELNFKAYPGETVAFRESRFNKFTLHSTIDPLISYMRYER